MILHDRWVPRAYCLDIPTDSEQSRRAENWAPVFQAPTGTVQLMMVWYPVYLTEREARALGWCIELFRARAITNVLDQQPIRSVRLSLYVPRHKINRDGWLNELELRRTQLGLTDEETP